MPTLLWGGLHAGLLARRGLGLGVLRLASWGPGRSFTCHHLYLTWQLARARKNNSPMAFPHSSPPPSPRLHLLLPSAGGSPCPRQPHSSPVPRDVPCGRLQLSSASPQTSTCLAELGWGGAGL